MIIKSYFGMLGPAGSLPEFSTVIKNAYEDLQGTEKYCKVLADEIHIKQGA